MESTPADGRDERDLGPVGDDGGIVGELLIHRDARAGQQRGQLGMIVDQGMSEVCDRRAGGQIQVNRSRPHHLTGTGEQLDDHDEARVVQ